MTDNFDSFLTDCLAQGERTFAREKSAVDVSEIEAAESDFGVGLPASYKHFLSRCGSGVWCDEPISHPMELYDLDSDNLEMEGFIVLVQNVRGVGDCIAFNPKDAEVAGERPVYYCSHDPFGYVRIAESFEGWLHKTIEAQKQGVDLYEGAI